ncbi:hypothetical protein LTR96_011118 [Exophiala xenobiotica]|nr:hypothetical protein LTR41_011267 [Exophiala xenobiotica]KAK5215779.1 hypothetical protein LTR72_011193 [Exophiala xenobiotica]KAK5220892.1 hypothetical protein LTR47_011048 [Exophiala xenobiotica]KAK5245535.1 hypothetical protein LTS06_009057 [Exophiala xenobiotica]KAK5263484.1 hypothetical protein LTR96_011118 [Exophiala xenobiotica]
MAAQLPKTMFAWRKHKGNPEPGHEGCGEIIEIGDQIKDSGFKIAAERTIVQNARGISLNFAKELITPALGKTGSTRHAPIWTSEPLPKCLAVNFPLLQLHTTLSDLWADIPSHVAAVATDAVKTSYHAIMRRGEVKPTETVVLFGLGGLGFNALQIVLHVGARVIVSDVRQERLDEAVKIGVPKEDAIPAGKSVQEFLKRRDCLARLTRRWTLSASTRLLLMLSMFCDEEARWSVSEH